MRHQCGFVRTGEFNAHGCVSSGSTTGERPQPYQSRFAGDNIVGKMIQQIVKRLCGAPARKRIGVVKAQPSHAITYGLYASSPPACDQRFAISINPLSAGTLNNRAPYAQPAPMSERRSPTIKSSG